jgi:hypothetical protein
MRAAESGWIPGLRSRNVISICIPMQRVQPLNSVGIIPWHRVLIETRGHRAIGIELAGRLAVKWLLVTLGSGGTRGRVFVVHFLPLCMVITHDLSRSEIRSSNFGSLTAMKSVQIIYREDGHLAKRQSCLIGRQQG